MRGGRLRTWGIAALALYLAVSTVYFGIPVLVHHGEIIGTGSDPEIFIWSLAGGGSLELGPLHGKDAVRAWLQDWIDMFDGFWMELVELIDAGGVTVFTEERYGGRARLSGVDTDQANWTVFTIRDGKIAGGREYWTREQALEAAGLSE